MDQTSSAENDAGIDDVITRRIKTIREKAMLEEVIEATTGRHRYQPKDVRVGWTRRVLGWFSRRQSQGRSVNSIGKGCSMIVGMPFASQFPIGLSSAGSKAATAARAESVSG